MSEVPEPDSLVEVRHREAYLELNRDQLLYLAAKRHGDVSGLIDLDKPDLADELALSDLMDVTQENWVSTGSW
jgi:hypothetical protein